MKFQTAFYIHDFVSFLSFEKIGEKSWIIKSILIQMQTFIRFFVRLW